MTRTAPGTVVPSAPAGPAVLTGTPVVPGVALGPVLGPVAGGLVIGSSGPAEEDDVTARYVEVDPGERRESSEQRHGVAEVDDRLHGDDTRLPTGHRALQDRPGAPDDGVSVVIPLPLLAQIEEP